MENEKSDFIKRKHNNDVVSNSKRIRQYSSNNIDQEGSKLECLSVELFIYYIFPYIQYDKIINIFFHLNTFFRGNVLSFIYTNKNINWSNKWLFESSPNLPSIIETININDQQIDELFPYPKLQSLFIRNIQLLSSIKSLQYLKLLKQLKHLNFSENEDEFLPTNDCDRGFEISASLFKQDSLLQSFTSIQAYLCFSHPGLNQTNHKLQYLTIHIVLLSHFPSLKYFYIKIVKEEWNDYEPKSTFILSKLTKCHFECDYINEKHFNFFLNQLKQSTTLRIFKLQVNQIDKVYTDDQIFQILPNLKKFYFSIRFSPIKFQPEILQKSIHNEQVMWYKSNDTFSYYSYISLPFAFKQLLNVTNNIVYYHLSGKKDILFPNVEYIQLSNNGNQLSPRLIQFINAEFPN